jgi:GMP synthase-like glutamine amidotransferase
MTRIAIIENGPSLCSFFGRALDRAGVEHFTFRAWRGASFPEEFDACILTGDFHNITDGLKDYHCREIEFLERLDGRKAFASCFAHQLVAVAHGGTIGHRETRLLGWERVHPEGENLLDFAPDYDAVCLNIEEVEQPPTDARVLASSQGCRYQLLSYGDSILTSQGHPEMAVRNGQWRVSALALMIAGGPTAEWRGFRGSRPKRLPTESPFMGAVVSWLCA